MTQSSKKELIALRQEIIERRKIEEALRASEARLRAQYKSLPLPTLSWRRQGDDLVLIDYNDAAEALTHGGIARFVGQSARDVYKGTPYIANYIERCFVEKKLIKREGEYQLQSTGERKYFAATFVFVSPDLVLMHAEDITAPKQAEEALRASEERYRSLFERSLDGVLLTTLEGAILAANPAACQIFGCTEEELCQIGRDGVVDPTDPRVACMLAERARAGQVRSEITCIRKDGEKFPAEIACKIFVDSNGESKTCMIVRDVTERKQTEEALRRSEADLRAIFNSSLGAFILLDSDKKLRTLNKTAQEWITRMFGRELQEGASIYEIVRPAIRDRFDDCFQTALQGKPAKEEYRLKGTDKTETWFEAVYTPVVDDKGQISGVCLSALNITARKRLEENLRASEKLAATGRMAARIAHEISNPLAGIKNAFLLIKRSLSADHPRYEFAGLIEEEIDRIARIVRQMYDLYRPDQEAARLFTIGKVAQDIVALLQHQCQEREVTIVLEILQPSPAVVLPESSLRQALFNLLINAIEASPRGGVVQVRTSLDGERLRIEVSDQGSGIPEAIQSQIFEPFFTTKGASTNGGLGLGLSVSKSLVEAMGGTLEFSSTPGQGAVFRLTVPCATKKETTEEETP